MSERLREIEEKFAAGQKAEAMALLQNFLAEDPDNPRALNNLGAMLQAGGDGAGAEAAFRRVLELSPENHGARANLALTLMAIKKWDEAADELRRLLTGNPNDPRLWFWLARVERSRGRVEASLDALDHSLALNPAQPILVEARKKLSEEIGRYAPGGEGPVEVLMCCQKTLESFGLELCRALEKRARVQKVVTNSLGPAQWPINSASTVWLEWGTALAAAVTNTPGLLDGKRVILRLHSFEILSREAGRINFEAVTDVVFVSHFMRAVFERLLPGRLDGRRVHIIHNGIDLERFPFASAGGGSKIAVVGKLDAKKDPMLMAQTFAFLLRRHPQLELHVAGQPDNNRYYMSLPDFLAKNNLEKSVRLYGQVDDMPGWLADKDYILSTSPFEAQGVAILEAAHRGCRPLVYSFPGAERLYPAGWLWKNLDELEGRLLEHSDPQSRRRFVAEHYSMERQADNFMKVILGEGPVVEPSPVGGD
ncbi:tetratricopeptide repeat protein [Deltaproteobacteria bacterium OttesenSCG-928-K17]|nr:tetratricopeptide repeat protein [Deltaproteobacteria bacterium OttesenSCG-928-K17]